MSRSSSVPRFVSYISLFAALVVTLCSNVPAQKVRLRSQITPACTSSQGANLKYADIYADGNVAVQGSYGCRGAFIYDITNADAPILASWYNPGNNQQFLEAIVIGNRGYFGNGSTVGAGGVHIVDLTNPYNPVLLGTVDSTHGGGYNTIHEMMVFDDGGQRYLLENSNSTSNRNLRIINVTNPGTPLLKWDFQSSDGGWVHAMHIRGSTMYLSGFVSSSRIDIYSIANLATQAPGLLGSVAVGGNSNHSAWTNETGEYLYSARELLDGDLRVYDVQNPAQPLLVSTIRAADLNVNAIAPHNPVVMGNYLYVSWYQAGVQIFDISNPTFPVRVGQYDTYQSAFAPPAEEKQAALGAEPWDVVCGSEFRQNALPTSYDGNWAVHPFLGQEKVLAGDLRHGLLVLDASEITSPLKNRVSDFDGDGRTDFSVFTPSTANWQIETSSNGAQTNTAFGVQDDVLTPGDYDGDGSTDVAIYRPSTGTWWISRSSDPFSFLVIQFGVSVDIPVPADYDADGRTDIAVWRPTNGAWYILQSTLGSRILQWGMAGDKPITGDFEGDGKADVVVWRPSNGIWYVLQSSSSIPMGAAWGMNGDRPVTGDFNGNGVSDFSVYRPSNGIWYILDPVAQTFQGYQFGIAEDVPVPADYDGDGRTDVAVVRPSTNTWYRINSTNGTGHQRVFGQTGDRPVPSSVQPQ